MGGIDLLWNTGTLLWDVLRTTFATDVQHYCVILLLQLPPNNFYPFSDCDRPLHCAPLYQEVVPFDLPSVHFTKIFSIAIARASPSIHVYVNVVHIRNYYIHDMGIIHRI